MIRLDRTAAEPLHQQLYRQIRDELVSGSFTDNSSRLPSTRALAADLGISRLTVNIAFEKLHAEGYLRSKIGSGTFVVDSLPETFLSPRRPKTKPLIEHPPRLSDRVKIFRINGPENSLISGSPARPVSLLFLLSRRLT